MDNFSNQEMAPKGAGISYWRSEFERIYVIAANKRRSVVTQSEYGGKQSRFSIVNPGRGEVGEETVAVASVQEIEVASF
jgi:hypothetical protein